MRALWFQKAFARDWLAKIWLGSIVIITFTILLFSLLPRIQDQLLSFNTMIIVLAILAVTVISYLVGLVAGSCIFPPVYRFVEKMNGAPFHKGDRVEILTKKNADNIAQVIEAGDCRYGASVILENDSELIRLSWHQIRRI